METDRDGGWGRARGGREAREKTQEMTEGREVRREEGVEGREEVKKGDGSGERTRREERGERCRSQGRGDEERTGR
jgi:hypothetical protein